MLLGAAAVCRRLRLLTTPALARDLGDRHRGVLGGEPC